MDNRRRQKELRRQRGERVFLFDASLSRCLGEAERDEWEWAIEMAGGNVGEAAKMAGLGGIPASARALWGKSSAHALDTYRHWVKKRETQSKNGKKDGTKKPLQRPMNSVAQMVCGSA